MGDGRPVRPLGPGHRAGRRAPVPEARRVRENEWLDPVLVAEPDAIDDASYEGFAGDRPD
jgi:hypothetical protein